MRRGSSHQAPRKTGETHPMTNPEVNPEMWVQLSVDQLQQTRRMLEEQQRQTNRLLDTVQQLQTEMLKVHSDNEKLMREHERTLKSLSDRKNPPSGQPSLERNTKEEGERCQAVHDNVQGC